MMKDRHNELDPAHWADLERKAYRAVARRSAMGIFFYFLLILLLALSLHGGIGGWMLSLVGVTGVLAVLRFLLVLRFDAFYPRAPRIWLGLYTASLMVSLTIWSGLSSWAMWYWGFGHPATTIGLLGTAAMSGFALFVFAPSRSLARSYFCVLIVPLLSVMLVLEDREAQWLALLGVLYSIYLWRASGRAHEEHWRGALASRLLAQRVAELEEARLTLRRAQDDLEERKHQTAELEAVNLRLQRDIAERLRAERQRREREEHVRPQPENLSEVFWILNAKDGVYIYVSPAYEQVWGRSCQALYENPGEWLDAIHPDHRARVREAHRARLESGRFFEDYQILRPDGTPRWIRDRGFPIYDDRGELDRLAGLAEDVTEQRRIESSLYERERDYRTIFENAHDPILIFRPEDEVVLNVNQRAIEVYGFEREEFVGLSMERISKFPRRGKKHISNTVAEGRCYNFETTQYRKDGREIVLEVNASMIEYQGRPAILSINRDVTERRRAEELRLAKEAAEHANKAKSQFLANMSHEIRTPMAGIIGLTELMLDDPLPARQQHRMEIIKSSSEQLLRLIDDLLDVSKIEAGRLTLEDRPFRLREMLANLGELFSARAAAKGLELRLDTRKAPDLWLRGDAARLRQVLMNLMGNAIKFTQRGSVAVEAELASGAERAELRLCVRDTGIGIPEAVQGRLFEPFFQVDSSTARHQSGTGLGLAISKSLVELMGGTIAVESTPGEGTAFRVTVPFEHAPAPAGWAPGSSHAGAGDELYARRGAFRILVAEDNPVNQIVAEGQLSALGYAFDVVGNGQEVLAAVGRKSYDLILMDCQMPGMDGFEATLRLRREEKPDRRVPIIAVTAHAMKGDREMCITAGMDDYISKPFRKEELSAMLDRWLLGPGIPRAAERSIPAAEAGEAGDAGEAAGDAPASSDAANAATSVLSPTAIEALRSLGRDSDRDVLGNVARRFLRRDPVEMLRRALSRGDASDLSEVAHTLKGGTSFVGAPRLEKLYAEIEVLARRGETERCADLLPQVEREFGHVKRELWRILEEGSPSC